MNLGFPHLALITQSISGRTTPNCLAHVILEIHASAHDVYSSRWSKRGWRRGRQEMRSHRSKASRRGHSFLLRSAPLCSFGSKRFAFNGNNEKKSMDGPENIRTRCISTFVTSNCPSLSVPSDLSLESARLFHRFSSLDVWQILNDDR